MEKQMKAERGRRESILRAEGQKKSAILVAEGEKESVILRAEAKKEAYIREAEGEAEAIMKIQRAKAESIKMLNAANTTREVLSLKAMETFEKVADGKSTKIIIPSELQSIANIATAFTEITNTKPVIEKEETPAEIQEEKE
jgi:regulator of protease activity HflC (stomatin/prohibitin superfamily)